VDSVEWLQAWYHRQCNNEWEHHYGISITTLDNPGWLLKIDLAGTALEHAAMEEVGGPPVVNHEGLEGAQEWLLCRVVDSRFEGAGGPSALGAICDVFRRWVEEHP
jgi:hypothetical protein